MYYATTNEIRSEKTGLVKTQLRRVERARADCNTPQTGVLRGRVVAVARTQEGVERACGDCTTHPMSVDDDVRGWGFVAVSEVLGWGRMCALVSGRACAGVREGLRWCPGACALVSGRA